MWKYYAFKITGCTLAYLPRRVGYWLAYIAANIIYVLLPSLRAEIADNMRHVMGSEADDAKLKQAVRGVLWNMAKNYFDLIKIPHMKVDDLKSCITTHGWHNLEDALNKGKGVILVTAHLGGFDMAAQIFAVRSVKTTVIVEPLEPPPVFSHVTALRETNGVTFMPAQSGVIGVVMQSLRRGEVLLLTCDRDIAKDGLRSNFFGEQTTLPTDAVLIAMRTGAAVVPVFNLRQEDGGYDVYFEPAVDIVPSGNEAVARNIEQIASVIEKYIKTCPEQWVVLSRIWAGGQ